MGEGGGGRGEGGLFALFLSGVCVLGAQKLTRTMIR